MDNPTSAQRIAGDIERAAHSSRRQRQELLTATTTHLMMGLVLVSGALSFLEESNAPLVTALFYAPIAVVLAIAEFLIRARKYRAAGWLVSLLFWAVVALATWFFGGLKYEMGTGHVIAVVVAAATLGGRAAIGFGLLSALSVSVVGWAQIRGILPESLSPESTINAWISLSVALLMAAFFLHMTIKSTEEAWVSAARAVEEKEQVESKYLVAQKLEPVGRLAAGVAHDFNNILTVMMNVSFLIRGADEQTRLELLDDLDAAIRRGELMTRQLLSFNRSRAFSRDPLDMTELLRTIVPVLGRLLGDEVEVVLDCPRSSLWVLADRGQIEQVIMNLGVNARDAMPRGGRLHIGCEPLGEGAEFVRLFISDTGDGMDDETRARAFEPFFSTKKTGTGLGLATVRDVVERHGGTIELSSTLGEGTSFVIVLPGTKAPERVVPSSDPPHEVHPLRLLLVEDEANVRKVHVRLLESMGHEVVSVGNGAEALSLVEAKARIDAIVSDVSMPVMSGIELAKRLEHLPNAPPVILVTGHLDLLPSELRDYQVVAAFLTKPVTRDAMSRALCEATTGRERTS